MLVSVHGIMSIKPPYQPVFWNCHDIACRFAFLAATRDGDVQLIRELSGICERAKFSFQRNVTFGYIMLSMLSIPGRTVESVVSREVSKRRMCADMLKLRFPRLDCLNDVTDEEWDEIIYLPSLRHFSWWTRN